MEFLWKDSNLLQNLFPDSQPSIEEVKILCPLIKDFDDLIKFYENDYKDFSNPRLVNLLEYLNYLDCSKITDLIIILKHKYAIWDFFGFGTKLPSHLQTKYDKVIIKDTLFESAVYHKKYDLAKYYTETSEGNTTRAFESCVSEDDVEEFALVASYFFRKEYWIFCDTRECVFEMIKRYDSYKVLDFMLHKYRFYVPSDIIYGICLNNRCKCLKVILNYYLDVSFNHVIGPSLIFDAAKWNRNEIVKILLDYDMIAIYPNNNHENLQKVLNMVSGKSTLETIIRTHPYYNSQKSKFIDDKEKIKIIRGNAGYTERLKI